MKCLQKIKIILDTIDSSNKNFKFFDGAAVRRCPIFFVTYNRVRALLNSRKEKVNRIIFQSCSLLCY